MNSLHLQRRTLLRAVGISAAGLAASGIGPIADVLAAPVPAGLGPLRQVHAGVVEIGYHETGPATGPVVLLLHGYPYDVHSFVEVAPLLAARGYRAITPYLRGHGTTRFLDAATPRAGQQGAIGADVIALLDALRIPRAIFAGFDWGGRAACVAAALWPDRCAGLVSVNSYLIQEACRPRP
jgi:pimeloyl-ACP methyl ester carboxylesterase